MFGDASSDGGFGGSDGNISGFETSVVLNPLADNGGKTHTHSLPTGSPAADAGNNAKALFGEFGSESPLTTDQRGSGFDRIVNALGGATATVDIGALEVRPLDGPLIVKVTDDELDADPLADLDDLSLREAVSLANSYFGADEITFDPSLMGQTITLTMGEFSLTDPVSVTGPGADALTIDADDQSRIFNIGSNAGDVTISGLTLTQGSVTGGSGGAVVSATTGKLTIQDSVLSDSHTSGATIGGGALAVLGGTADILRSTISGNTAGGNGGAIYNTGTLTVDNVAVTENSGTEGGGIFHASAANSLNILNSELSENTASGSGGGVFADGADVSVTNSTLYGNAANFFGGGIWALTTSLEISNSTLVGNRADADGNASGVGGGYAGHTVTGTLQHNIFASNFRGSGTAPDDITADFGQVIVDSANSTNNLVADAASAGGLTDGNLGNIVGVDWKTVIANDGTDATIAANGGDTRTIALLSDGPAVDAGESPYTGSLTTDQRGGLYGRVVDGNKSGTAIIDIGAFEFQPSAVLAITPDSTTTNTATITFTFQFDTDVAGFDATDIALANGTADDFTAVDANTYTLVVSPTADGAVTASVAADATLGGNNVATASVTSDRTAPTVTVTVDDTALKSGDTATITFTFSEAPEGFTADDVTVGNGTFGSITATANPLVFTATLSPNADIESATNAVSVAADYTDAIGNTGSAGTSTNYTVDTKPPTIVSFTRQSPATSPTTADSLVLRATFSESVSNVDAADFEVDSTSTASITDVTQVSASVYGVTVSGGNLADFEGQVGLDLASTHNITDLAGNVLPNAQPATDEEFVVENPDPGITLSVADLTVSEAGSTATFTVVLNAKPASDVVLTVTSSDLTEATVSVSSLTFTTNSWDDPQTVTVAGLPDNDIADGDVMSTVTVAVDANSSDNAYDLVTPATVSVTTQSHSSRNVFVLNGRGRQTDFIDVVSTTGNTNLDLELRSTDGTILSPGIAGRVSLAGYPEGTYEVWVNDAPANYTITASAMFGQAMGEPATPGSDIDGDGGFSFANDGIILLAYALGSRDAALEPFRAGNMRSGRDIQIAIEQLADGLDLDGNGEFQFSSDGILLLAYALGSRGSALDGFRATDATRTGAQIQGRLDGLFSEASGTGNRLQTSDVVSFGSASLPVDGPIVIDVDSQSTSTTTASESESLGSHLTIGSATADSDHANATESDDESGEVSWEEITHEIDAVFADQIMSQLDA